MNCDVSLHITELINYAIRHKLIEKEDVNYSVNRLLDVMHTNEYAPCMISVEERQLSEILDDLISDAVKLNVLSEGVTITEKDLFDTALMGALTPRPSEVIKRFRDLYAKSPEKATAYYYDFSIATNYIREDRIAKDKKWIYTGKYGDLDITVNLSKPEKDPKAIAAAKFQKQTGYPKCALCAENEGFFGSVTQAPRQNHRLIPLALNGKKWYLQYSPYVYYNEHCIVLSDEHTPMKIDRVTFSRLLEFVTQFPHYFIGSNADLPIVGGSILTHEHMQGGRYVFAMEKAPIEKEILFENFPTVQAGIVCWPMSVIRLISTDREKMIDLADKVLSAWRCYSDIESGILSESNGELHNTITPIARRCNDAYVLDLVLRNNRTTAEYPMGIFHPHADKHNIKKENIGLIEVMGLAVLPARLKNEMSILKECIVNQKDFSKDEMLSKHYLWYCSFKDKYNFTKSNTEEILEKEIGKTFEEVLEDAGVYKRTKKGQNAFLKFITSIK